MLRDVVVYNGRIVHKVSVSVRLRDGYVTFECPRVSFVGRYHSYRLDKYRFMFRLIDKYCGINVFFVNRSSDGTELVPSLGYSARKMLDNKEK